MTGLHALHQGVAVLLPHRIDEVDARLVNRQDVRGGQYAHVGGHDGLGRRALAVAGDGHVPQHVDIADVPAKAILSPKWSQTALADSIMRSMNSSFEMSHMSSEPGVV